MRGRAATLVSQVGSAGAQLGVATNRIGLARTPQPLIAPNDLPPPVCSVYTSHGSKEDTMRRWAANYGRLSPRCRARLTGGAPPCRCRARRSWEGSFRAGTSTEAELVCAGGPG